MGVGQRSGEGVGAGCWEAGGGAVSLGLGLGRAYGPVTHRRAEGNWGARG